MIVARVELDMSPAEDLSRSGIRLALRVGMNRAASPVKAAVVSHAAAVRRLGHLAKSIRIRLREYPADRWAAVVGPTTKYVRTKGRYTRGRTPGAARFIKPAKYAHLVEKGTARSRAKPWLRPAHDATAQQFLDRVGAEVGGEIERRLARRAK